MSHPDTHPAPAASAGHARRPATPLAAWRRLEDGNARFVHGMSGEADTGYTRRAELTAGQRPFAMIIGCSDSRVPAELVFDQGLGDLFVIRTAGHVADGAVLGSMEYGIAVLGIGLVVVLGHEACGAVGATTDSLDAASMPGGFIRDIVERITPSVMAARKHGGTTSDEVVEEHVRHTADHLTERSRVLADALAAGTVAVVGGTYALGTGRVRLVHTIPATMGR